MSDGNNAKPPQYKPSVSDIITHEVPVMGTSSAESYEGRYGNYGYGNVTVWLDSSTEDLYMEYGPIHWRLSPTENQGLYYGEGQDDFWYWSIDALFQRDNDDVVNVTVSLDDTFPPVFERDLDFNNLPPPPELC